ncbi:MAG: COQ9 family protein [Janthinobacterium lividum]
MYVEIEQKYQRQRIEIIKSIVECLPYFEWDRQLIREAEANCGFNEGYCWILFGNKLENVISFYEEWQDELMSNLLSSREPSIKVREKISDALKIRIKYCSSKKNISKNRIFFLKPKNYALGTKLAWQTCDKIWHYAGDNSIDFNYYSKRSLLFGVYLSSLNYYINDQSDDCQKTDQFIDQALAKIINLASLKSKIPTLENIPIIRLFL